MFPNQFKTARLVLRPIEAGDATAIFESYAQDPVVSRYLVWQPHLSITDTQIYIGYCLEELSSRTYVLLERGSGHLVGCLDIRLEDLHRIGFGYVLSRSQWGKGLMTEVLSSIAMWALQQDGVWRVEAVCDVENPGSARVMEKAGLRCEGILQKWSIHPNLGPEPRDCFSYARVR